MNSVMTVKTNPWAHLREYTDARIALGRSGASMPTSECLSFQLDHARAKDAVLDPFNSEMIIQQAESLSARVAIQLESAASDKREFLMRPDLGRKLSDVSSEELRGYQFNTKFDLSVTVSDGLSARAIHQNFAPFMKEFLPLVADLSLSPMTVVSRGRVAVADEIGMITGAQISVILIGERPGLKSPDSMGIYMTREAKPGTTDERRNCISNVRPEGLSYALAASKLNYLIRESLRRGISGVELKDEQKTFPVNAGAIHVSEAGTAKIAV